MIFERLKIENEKVNSSFLFKLDVSAMSYFIADNVLVPSKLVLGIIPRFPITSHHLHNHREHMNIFAKVPIEINAISTE